MDSSVERDSSSRAPLPLNKTPVHLVARSASKAPWRLLWKGGLSLGYEGWFLEGLAFFGKIDFGDKQSASPKNPFDVDPFADLHSQDTDLCLSLETLRGRKALQYRGLVPLRDEDLMSDVASTDHGVQMSIAHTALHTQHFVASQLCKQSQLTAGGRTTLAMDIGLGDEDLSPNASIIVYGQLVDGLITERSDPSILKLMVARKRQRTTDVRPGEPLPRDSPLEPPVGAIKKAASFDLQLADKRRRAAKRRRAPLMATSEVMMSSGTEERAMVQVLMESTDDATACVEENVDAKLRLIVYDRLRSRGLTASEEMDIAAMAIRGTTFAMSRQAIAISRIRDVYRIVDAHLDLYI